MRASDRLDLLSDNLFNTSILTDFIEAVTEAPQIDHSEENGHGIGIEVSGKTTAYLALAVLKAQDEVFVMSQVYDDLIGKKESQSRFSFDKAFMENPANLQELAEILKKLEELRQLIFIISSKLPPTEKERFIHTTIVNFHILGDAPESRLALAEFILQDDILGESTGFDKWREAVEISMRRVIENEGKLAENI